MRNFARKVKNAPRIPNSPSKRMKLKEIPKSVYHTLRLRSLRPEKLKAGRGVAAPVVVTLTAIPSRMGRVDLVIRSLLDQDLPPAKIVLWLPESLRGSLPRHLTCLLGERFEIGYTPLTCPHKKLIHTLERYPYLPAVTCDDDMIYARTWLKELYEAHLQNPKCITGHQLRCIRYGADGALLPYKEWVLPKDGTTNPRALLAVGAGGVLYPPGSLDPRVQNRDLFMELCPRADDLWFKAMGLLAGTCIQGTPRKSGEPIPILGSQKTSLKKTNIGQDGNRAQWLQLEAYFQFKSDQP